jgi:hypothetical protein
MRIVNALSISLFFFSLQTFANDSDFAKYENSISMTCYPDSGEMSQWSYNGSFLIMDGLPLQINGESVKKKSGENVFLIKTEYAEFYIDFEQKRQIASTFGMEFESRCF